MGKMSFLSLFLVVSVLLREGTSLARPNIPKDDRFRPQIHYSVPANWANDPNGMVYLDGEYHLYYQYNPFSSVADGNTMHWGHAVSTNLVKWTDLPTALSPDHLGAIWSGSAVVDYENTAGFQTGATPPIVAIFTHFGPLQQQSLAYSNDKGRTFTKYEGNPVIPNPVNSFSVMLLIGTPDFRDPKVIRYGDSWIMVLAAGPKVDFFRSRDLKSWEFLSDFGSDPPQGAHGGPWECPDFLEMKVGDDTVWVLIVSLDGGPNGHSATQYFVGDFDGTTFSSSQMDPLWMDWGLDNYASVSFSNEPRGRWVMMGWMANWEYAGSTPTEGWRGQFTLPRMLGLELANGQLRLQSTPVPELNILLKNGLYHPENITIAADEVFDMSTLNNPLLHIDLTFDIHEMKNGASIAICLVNSLGQELCTGLDKGRERPIFLNRELSGLGDFHPAFARRASAAREVSRETIRFEIYVDVSAIEVFVDSGLTCMTGLFYPGEPYTGVEIRHHASGNPDSSIVLSTGFVEGLLSMGEI
nr:putative GH32 family protein [Tomocerus qinae]